jgi:hypothetical protein
MKKLVLSLCLTAAPVLSESTVTLEPLPEGSVSAEDGTRLWGQIHEVFSHPRCANCHVGESGIPIWSGPHYGAEPRNHGMFVAAGDSRIGAEYLTCGTCHGPQNSVLPHGAPGAEVWHLPPAEMAWWGKSSAEICAQIKDPDLNGGRSLLEVAEHVAGDPLVLWGWEPGPGRTPAPYSAKALSEFMLEWTAAGAPCPTG